MNINDTLKFRPFYKQLKKCADNCFTQGLPSTTFARTLAHDCYCYGLEVPSNDDYYHLYSTPGNKAMRDLLEWLGYRYTEFGIRRQRYFTCLYVTNNLCDFVVSKTFEDDTLERAYRRAKGIKYFSKGKYPVINVQQLDGDVLNTYYS